MKATRGEIIGHVISSTKISGLARARHCSVSSLSLITAFWGATLVLPISQEGKQRLVEAE